jgi:hypothetical protein
MRISERARVVVFGIVAAGWIILAVATLLSAFGGRPLIARS